MTSQAKGSEFGAGQNIYNSGASSLIVYGGLASRYLSIFPNLRSSNIGAAISRSNFDRLPQDLNTPLALIRFINTNQGLFAKASLEGTNIAKTGVGYITMHDFDARLNAQLLRNAHASDIATSAILASELAGYDRRVIGSSMYQRTRRSQRVPGSGSRISLGNEVVCEDQIPRTNIELHNIESTRQLVYGLVALCFLMSRHVD